MREELRIERGEIIKFTILQGVIFLGIAIAYALIFGGGLASIGILRRGLLSAIGWGVLLFLAIVPVLYLPKRLGIRNRLEEEIAGRLGAWDILALNLLVSSSEELFFRGFLLRIVGVVPSAIVFGIIHYIGYVSLAEVAYALSTGLLLGFVYKYLIPNIFFAITFHYLANAFALLITRRSVLNKGTKGIETDPHT
jgi:membrane protease YdiL (CAAX protease family)